jgi:hypothetical protein
MSMNRIVGSFAAGLRNALAFGGAVAVGVWLGNGNHVKAATSSGGDVVFQLTGANEASSLLVYQPETKSVYVYRGATQGNSTVQCSYKFVLGSPGGAIQRVNCPVGSAF